MVIYELEQLAAASSSAGPDWGFKAAVALTAKGASHVLHFELPGGVGAGTGAGRGTGGRRRKAAATAGRQRSWLGGGRKVEEGEVEEEREEEGAEEDLEGEHGGEERLPAHVLAVAAYGSDEIVLYGLMYGRTAAAAGGAAGLSTSVLQRIRLPGVSSVAACRGGGGQLFLMGLSYFDKGFSTRSAVYRWGGKGRGRKGKGREGQGRQGGRQAAGACCRWVAACGSSFKRGLQISTVCRT